MRCSGNTIVIMGGASGILKGKKFRREDVANAVMAAIEHDTCEIHLGIVLPALTARIVTDSAR
ncbi:MAG TPA: hypothetical protein VNH83_30305 [Bryobacteraceae bacterium]|nr:hypothetical protein [Bryobacteraceae bacterium]